MRLIIYDGHCKYRIYVKLFVYVLWNFVLLIEMRCKYGDLGLLIWWRNCICTCWWRQFNGHGRLMFLFRYLFYSSSGGLYWITL